MFNKFKQEQEQEETGVLVPLKGRNGQPYQNADGSVPHLRIAGPYSTPVRQAEQSNARRLVQLMQTEATDADVDDGALRRSAAAVIGWEHLQDDNGTPVPYSHDNALELLKAAPWVHSDVLVVLSRYARFFGDK